MDEKKRMWIVILEHPDEGRLGFSCEWKYKKSAELWAEDMAAGGTVIHGIFEADEIRQKLGLPPAASG